MWSESDYMEALSAAQSETDPKAKAALQAEIRRYQALNPQVAQPTGLQAIEASRGETPLSREERDQGPLNEDLDKLASGAVKKQPPRARNVGKAAVPTPWYEPSLERFKSEMRPILGDRVEDLGEDAELYQEYANRLWSKAADEAEQKGESLTRVKELPSEGWSDKLKNIPAELLPFVQSLALGADETSYAGAGKEVLGYLSEALGIDPETRAKLEEGREWSPTARTIGNVAGYLNPLSPAMLGGSAAIKFVGPKLSALATKAGGGLLPRAAAKGATASAAGATGLATEGAAQELVEQRLGDANPFDPLGFLERRGEEAAIGAAAGPAAELVGGVAGTAGKKLAEKTAKRIKQAEGSVAGLSQEELMRLVVLHMAGAGPLTMAAASVGKSEPLLRSIGKLQSVPSTNPFIPGFAGGILATPLTEKAPGQVQGDKAAIEQLLREMEEPAPPPPAESEKPKPPRGYRFQGETEPAGVFGDIAESVTNLFGEKKPPPADYKSDREFMAMLKKLDAVTDPEERADVRAGYIRNYKTWRADADAARAEGDLNPDLSLKLTGRFNTRGYLKPGEEAIAANKQIGEMEGEEVERGAGIPPDKQEQARKEIEKALGGNYTADDVVKAVAQRVAVGATVPAADRVFDAIKALGFNVPMDDVARILRSYQELTI